MERMQINRREFIQNAAAIGTVALAAGTLFKGQGAETKPPAAMAIYRCTACGHLEFGSAPDTCPVCHSTKDKFERNDQVFTEAQTKFKDMVAVHTPQVKAMKKSSLVTEEPSIAVEAKVGKTIHPMEEAHMIRFIDCYIDDKHVSRLSLTLANHPTMGIDIRKSGMKVRVVEWCNLHGYWQAEAMAM